VPMHLIVVGALGRMGKEIARVALADSTVTLAGCVEVATHPDIGRDYGTLLGEKPLGVALCGDIVGLPITESVIIDFSVAANIDALLDKIAGRSTRVVIGTTGLSDASVQKIRGCARSIPVVFSPNYSLGVNLLFYLTEVAAARLKEFDLEVIEAHHHHKADAPSGTARRIGEILAASRGLSYDKAVRNGRAGMVGARTRDEIGMHAVRGGDIAGDHTVLFAGAGERLELRHMAHSRAPLAQGAVHAAKWLASQTPGLYSMRDVLGLL